MARIPALIPCDEELLLGSSAASKRLLAQLQRVSGTPGTTVLLLGPHRRESELAARTLHARSGETRASGPFLSQACARTPEGAIPELLDAARGGTLYLEEVLELSDHGQAALAEGLAARSGEGGSETEARVVASTAGDLDAEVGAVRFREDLLYRLNVLTVRIPTLEERREELGELIDHVVRRLRPSRPGARPRLSQANRDALQARAWTGGLQQLEATLALAANESDAEDGLLELGAGSAARDADWIPRAGAPDNVRPLREVEEETIRRALTEVGGNRSRAARSLGINRQTLYNKLRAYGIS